MFPFENLIEYIQTLKITDPPTILLKFRLMFILLFIHLRKDFQMIKSLTSVDFLTNTILERLEYKKILTKKSIFNHLIDKKYKTLGYQLAAIQGSRIYSSRLRSRLPEARQLI